MKDLYWIPGMLWSTCSYKESNEDENYPAEEVLLKQVMGTYSAYKWYQKFDHVVMAPSRSQYNIHLYLVPKTSYKADEIFTWIPTITRTRRMLFRCIKVIWLTTSIIPNVNAVMISCVILSDSFLLLALLRYLLIDIAPHRPEVLTNLKKPSANLRNMNGLDMDKLWIWIGQDDCLLHMVGGRQVYSRL